MQNIGPVTRFDNVSHNVNFFTTQAMGSIATYGSVYMDTCVSEFYCDIDLNNEVILTLSLTHCLNGPLK